MVMGGEGRLDRTARQPCRQCRGRELHEGARVAAADRTFVGEGRVDLAYGLDGERCRLRPADAGKVGELEERWPRVMTWTPPESLPHEPVGA